VPTLSSYDYAIVRVVPRVEREEFLNAGAIVFSRALGFLDARIDLDRARLTAFAPWLDPSDVAAQLALIPRICAGDSGAGPIAEMPPSERFHWLTAPRSTVVQTSPVHAGLSDDPRSELEHLVETMVRTPAPPASADAAPASKSAGD
jgi:hypothetical protein